MTDPDSKPSVSFTQEAPLVSSIGAANPRIWLYQFDPITGDIFAALESPSDVAVQHMLNDRPELNCFVDEPNPEYGNFWYNGHQMVHKSGLPIILDKTEIKDDGEDVATFSGIPVNAIVTLDGDTDVSAEVKGGILQVHSAEQGKYVFVFQCPGYFAASYQVEAS